MLVRPTLEHYLRFNEAREVLGVSRSAMNRMLADGRLRGRKLRFTWRFLPEDLAACLAERARADGQKPVDVV